MHSLPWWLCWFFDFWLTTYSYYFLDIVQEFLKTVLLPPTEVDAEENTKEDLVRRRARRRILCGGEHEEGSFSYSRDFLLSVLSSFGNRGLSVHKTLEVP